MSRDKRSRFEEGVNLYRLAMILSARGEVDEAEKAFRRSLAFWEGNDSFQRPDLQGFMRACLAQQALWMEQPSQAIELANLACDFFRVDEKKFKTNMITGQRLQGMALKALGRHDEAAVLLETALSDAQAASRVEEDLLIRAHWPSFTGAGAAGRI